MPVCQFYDSQLTSKAHAPTFELVYENCLNEDVYYYINDWNASPREKHMIYRPYQNYYQKLSNISVLHFGDRFWTFATFTNLNGD